MEIKVKVYINNVLVPHEDLHRYEIKNNRTIDRIVNDIIKKRVEIVDEDQRDEKESTSA